MSDDKIKIGSMIMIGAAGRNAGKTELACALIRKFSKTRPVVGIKVTTIKDTGGKCPRGGEGCGVCSSLESDFDIAEETNPDQDKDTARLLAAGAADVFWLRVMDEYLRDTIPALIGAIGPDRICVCESNSIRNVVEPGLFLMVKSNKTDQIKPSAAAVIELADKVVTSDGGSFDLDIDQITIKNNRPFLKENATAIITAGGAAKRMGTDKGSLQVKGVSMIEYIYRQIEDSFDEVLISSNDADAYSSLGPKVIADRTPDQGPLMAIASAVEASQNELNFVVACDIPNIKMSFVRQLLAGAEDAEIVIPTTGDEKIEPLFAVYRKNTLDRMNQALDAGKRRIREVFPQCRVKYMKITDPEWLINLNTPAEYRGFCDNLNIKP